MTKSIAANGAMGTRNWDDDMAHVHGAWQFREDLAAGEVAGVYGDSCGGRSFTDSESATLIAREKAVRPVTACGWHQVWAGPGCTRWTIINCQPETRDEIAMFREAEASM